MAPTNSKRFYTVSELARELGFTSQTVRRHINSQLIPAARIAVRGSFRVPADVAQQLINRFKQA